MRTDKLQLLVDNKLSGKDREELIEEIKNNPQEKMELALLMKIREIGRHNMKTTIKAITPNPKHSKIAKFSLAEIRRAAFGQNKNNVDLTSLPIKDDTLTDFLNDDNSE